MIQKLQGIKITPRGNTRFSSQNWPSSYAFGGWIYNASASVNFSNSPTEIKVNVVLETTSLSQSQAKFDILESDLRCDAGNGGIDNESWFDINFDGYEFKNFSLYAYDFSIEAGQKILNILFKDYSIILDKIYVGLFKKQGYKHPHLVSCQLELPIRCLDCQYTGSSITGVGAVSRDIGFASYAGINGNTYDLFSDSYYRKQNVFNEWSSLISSTTNKGGQFDLNGGYLILGTESATEERCNSAPNITYSFIEMLASLRNNGISLEGKFPKVGIDSDYIYRNNHIGTLREVMQNWCSDLGYDFYCSGRTFVGIDLKTPIDISDIIQISDPTSKLGKFFQINSDDSNTSIISFNTTATLDNTFKQAVIVENSYPITSKEISKNVKRYVGITPLHPISLNEISSESVTDRNVYGVDFQRRKFEIPYFDSDKFTDSYIYNFARLDGRSYNDVDTAIALSNYNDTLRDIFVAQRALFNQWVFKNAGDNGSYTETVYWRPSEHITNNYATDPNGSPFKLPETFNGAQYWPLENAYCRANFAALGVFPILEIVGEEFKSAIIEDNFKNADKNGIANINIDQKYFRVFLGYYYENVKSEIMEWEKSAADSMYKFGIVTKGTSTQEPFVPANLLNDISPTSGFYGENGLTYTRIKNNFTPSTERYQDVKFSPFSNVLLYSGYVKTTGQGVYYENKSIYNAFIPPGFSDYAGRLPTGLWVSEIQNPWGTLKQNFDRQLSFALEDECAKNYTLDQGVSQILTDSDKTLQDWRLEYFKPIVNPDLSTISEIIQSDEFSFDTVVDEVTTYYTDLHFIQKKDCKKLHIIIIPDTTIHPNVNILFTQKPVNKINNEALKLYKNKLYEANLNKNTTQTPSICSISLLDEMCRNVLSGGYASSFTFPVMPTNLQTGCVILEDKNNYMLEGFQKNVLFSPNSRSLEIKITKNHDRSFYPSFDINSDYYYSDLALGSLVLEQRSVIAEIVYPIQSFSDSKASYSGIYSSDIYTEYRIPALTKIYGEPVNVSQNNTSAIKILNNSTDNTLNPILDPLTTQVKSYITVLDGVGDSIIRTPEQYYNYIKNLNNYNLNTPMKSVRMTLAGSPGQFGNFLPYLNPLSGLQNINLTISDNGVKTDLSFSDRPKVLPRQESLLNKIGPRIKGIK